jgi:ABC-type phosphate/phosphonate transport system permease subunit
MENEKEQLEALQDIRKMMKDSSKFLSLSGLSGVFAGLYALAGAYLGHRIISKYLADGPATHEYDFSRLSYPGLLLDVIFISIVVLVLSISTALYLSLKKAKKTNQKLFDHTSKKVFWCMAIPLVAGGLFCVAILVNGSAAMVSSVMLLFYGLALVSASKYTMTDIKYLGYLEITIGLLAAFFPGHGLLFWALGFGILHVIYGSIVWFKYDRTD